MTRPLHYGIYEALLDRDLKEALEHHPELRSVLGKIDFEEQPARYAAFLAAVIEQALRQETDPASRLAFCNRLIEQISGLPDRAHIGGRCLVEAAEQLLLEITPPNYAIQGLPRPDSPLTETSLFTGSPSEPQLAHELHAEMHSADSVDILVSFIKWSGLRLLMKAFEDLRTREVPVRAITTAYMGASDAAAVEWLAGARICRAFVAGYSSIMDHLKRFGFGAQEVEVGLIAESTITAAACGFNEDPSINEPGYGFGGGGLCCFEQPHDFGDGDNRMGRQ